MKKKALLQLITFIIISFYATITCGNNKIDSLKLELNNTKDNEAHLSILNQIADEFFNLDFKQYVMASRNGVDHAEKVNSKKWMPVFYEKLGRGYANTSVLDSAKIFFDKAVIGYNEVDNKRGMATTYFKLAWLGRATNNYDDAMKYDLNALKIMEELDDKRGICNAYSRLAETLYLQQKPKETLKYALQSIAIGESNDIGIELFYSYMSAADAYMLMGTINKSKGEENEINQIKVNHEKSLEMYNKAFDYGKKSGMEEISFVNLVNKQGNAYKKLEKYDLALSKYKESLEIAQNFKYESYYCIPKANIGEVYKRQGEYGKALVVFKEVADLIDKNGQPKDNAEIFGHISEVYEKLSDHENAFKYFKLERNLTDNALSVEKENAMNEIRTVFETVKKDDEIKSQTLALSNQKMIRNLILSISILLASFLAFFYRNSQSRKRTNQALEKTNNLLDIKNQQNEVLLKEIHHRVKNNLQTISSLLSLQSKSINDPSALDAVQESRNRVGSMALIHQKLYQGENLAAIKMRDYFETIGSTIINSFGAKAQGIELEVNMSEIELDVDTAIPIGLITNELITNSLKYAFQEKESGKISISMIKKEDNLIHLEIADNGIHKSEGISEGGTGFGTMLINLLTTQLGGQLEQTIENGTATIIKFKLNKQAA